MNVVPAASCYKRPLLWLKVKYLPLRALAAGDFQLSSTRVRWFVTRRMLQATRKESLSFGAIKIRTSHWVINIATPRSKRQPFGDPYLATKKKPERHLHRCLGNVPSYGHHGALPALQSVHIFCPRSTSSECFMWPTLYSARATIAVHPNFLRCLI